MAATENIDHVRVVRRYTKCIMPRSPIPLFIRICALLIATQPLPLFASERVALVIGNADYDEDGVINPGRASPIASTGKILMSDLANPVNDASLIAKTLRTKGFDVRLEKNLNRQDLLTAIEDFSSRLEMLGPDTQALLYFAGHGVQIENRQFLAPVGSRISIDASPFYGNAEDISRPLVAIDDFRYPKNRSGKGWTLVVLDSCRENPWPTLAVRGIPKAREAQGPKQGAVSKGPGIESMSTRPTLLVSPSTLSSPSAPGTQTSGQSEYLSVYGPGHNAIEERGLLMLAAEPGSLALDGHQGSNSPVAGALASALLNSTSIEAALSVTRSNVRTRTQEYQVPHVYRGSIQLLCGTSCARWADDFARSAAKELPVSAASALSAVRKADAAQRAGRKAHADNANEKASEALLQDFPALENGKYRVEIWEYYQEGGLQASFTGQREVIFAGRYAQRCSIVMLRARCPTEILGEHHGTSEDGRTWLGHHQDFLTGVTSMGTFDTEGENGKGLKVHPNGQFELGLFQQGTLIDGMSWSGPRGSAPDLTRVSFLTPMQVGSRAA